MSFKKQVRDFVSTNRTVMSVAETQGAKDDVIAAYVAGAKYAARLALGLDPFIAHGELVPASEEKCYAILAQLQEVVDHE